MFHIIDWLTDIFLPFNEVMNFIKECIENCIPQYFLLTLYIIMALSGFSALILMIRGVFH